MLENEMQTPEINEGGNSELEKFIEECLMKVMMDGMKLKGRLKDSSFEQTIEALKNIVGSKMEEINRWLNDPEKIKKHLHFIEFKTNKE